MGRESDYINTLVLLLQLPLKADFVNVVVLFVLFVLVFVFVLFVLFVLVFLFVLFVSFVLYEHSCTTAAAAATASRFVNVFVRFSAAARFSPRLSR